MRFPGVLERAMEMRGDHRKKIDDSLSRLENVSASICPLINELREALRRLSANHDKLFEIEEAVYSFLSLAPDMLCVLRKDSEHYRFIWVSHSWEDFLGWKEEELVGKQPISFVYEKDYDRSVEVGKTFMDGFLMDFRNRFKKSNGDYSLLSWRATRHGEYVYAIVREVEVENDNNT